MKRKVALRFFPLRNYYLSKALSRWIFGMGRDHIMMQFFFTDHAYSNWEKSNILRCTPAKCRMPLSTEQRWVCLALSVRCVRWLAKTNLHFNSAAALENVNMWWKGRNSSLEAYPQKLNLTTLVNTSERWYSSSERLCAYTSPTCRLAKTFLRSSIWSPIGAGLQITNKRAEMR